MGLREFPAVQPFENGACWRRSVRARLFLTSSLLADTARGSVCQGSDPADMSLSVSRVPPPAGGFALCPQSPGGPQAVLSGGCSSSAGFTVPK